MRQEDEGRGEVWASGWEIRPLGAGSQYGWQTSWVARPEPQFRFPNVYAVITLYTPLQRTPISTTTPGQGALVKGRDGRREAIGSWQREVSRRIRVMQNPRQFKVVMDSLLSEEESSNHFIWILRARRAQKVEESETHPGLRHLGICRLVITFRHSLTVTPIILSQRQCVRQSILHTQLPRLSMWEEVFLGGQGGVCPGKQEAWIPVLVPALHLVHCDLEQDQSAF